MFETIYGLSYSFFPPKLSGKVREILPLMLHESAFLLSNARSVDHPEPIPRSPDYGIVETGKACDRGHNLQDPLIHPTTALIAVVMSGEWIITVYTIGLGESSTPDHHVTISGPHLKLPSESNEKVYNGQGTTDTPVLSDVIAGRTGLRQITNADLGLKDSHSDSIRKHTTAGYMEATMAEFPAKSGAETLHEAGFSPAAIAITICGILSFLALEIGISAMVVCRRRMREFDFNVAAEGDESVSKTVCTLKPVFCVPLT
ncbi:unnamed protein product [Dibothriocephalus latus]|uniref:Uncharacterized protein n=1 Tax=Dibothriocephalus latus TaxID=60516 RepID=A0A3P7NQY5_DIBLA|nr:unnamed protein product [Dibothriocephalus latus]